MRVRVSEQWTSGERLAVQREITLHVTELQQLFGFVEKATAADLETARTIGDVGLRRYLDRRLLVPIGNAHTPCTSCTGIFDDHPTDDCGEFVP